MMSEIVEGLTKVISAVGEAVAKSAVSSRNLSLEI